MHDGTPTSADTVTSAAALTGQLRFDRYVLDLARGCLLKDGDEIALRPKTFAVLRHLVENAHRLVSKDELFAAVWPNVAVTDDALVQSIGELRRALGEAGARLIKTVPRRGYRFEADVTAAGGNPAGDATVAATDASAPASVPAPAAPTPHAPPAAAWRLGVSAVVALGIVLAANALWLGSQWNFGGAPHTAGKNTELGAKPAIAVFPLVDQSDDAREYFADGLTQDIINALGRFSSLTVMSWNAVFPYKGKPARPDEIRQNLAVNYLVEGNVRQAGDRVRVTAQLVDTPSGRVLWSARFDEALTDVFALQDKMTAEIVAALAIRVTQIEQRRVFAKPTENLEAYDYVLRARPASQRPTRANTAEARVLLRRAIELDANYAAAYAALAETYHTATAMGWAQSPAAFLERAEDFATKALGLDDANVQARIVLARVHLFFQRYDQARAEIDRAIAINPNDAHGLSGRGNILMWSGETDAAIESLELAQRIDPELNAVDRNALSLAYYLKGRYDEAVEQAQRNLRKTEDTNFSYVVLAAAYAQQSRFEDAARAAAATRRLYPAFDPQEFGTKFLNPADRDLLRDGLRKARLAPADAAVSPADK
jgi:TolB-like protein/DNA-binding winged helix-turn-helix (wHTH) protein/cytochrome c-type biogenesis protein CcmH/NrfG